MSDRPNHPAFGVAESDDDVSAWQFVCWKRWAVKDGIEWFLVAAAWLIALASCELRRLRTWKRSMRRSV